jgi:type I restriction enzyme S subunit
MKDSGVEWLGEVPEHWDVAAVGHKYSVQLGKMLDSAQQTGDHSKPYLRVADVQWDSINTNDLPEMDFPPHSQERYLLKAGDLLVNEGGSYVGRAAIWEEAIEECYYQKALHRLRAYQEVRDSTHFMYWLMEYATKTGVFIAGGNQTTIDHLTAEQLRKYRFGFPSLEEQFQIADYVRLATGKLLNLTKDAENLVKILQERRSALISAAVTGQIDVRVYAPEAAVA